MECTLENYSIKLVLVDDHTFNRVCMRIVSILEALEAFILGNLV